MVVVKMRGGNHSKDIREYVITDKGVVISSPRETDYTGLTTGLTTGLPQRIGRREEFAREPKAETLTSLWRDEVYRVLQALGRRPPNILKPQCGT